MEGEQSGDANSSNYIKQQTSKWRCNLLFGLEDAPATAQIPAVPGEGRNNWAAGSVNEVLLVLLAGRRMLYQ